MTETLSTTEMLPTKMEPKLTHLFHVIADDIDSFLFHSIERPTVLGKKEIVAYLHDTIAPSAEQQLRNVVASQTLLCQLKRGFKQRNLMLRQVDAIGAVISKTTYHGVKIKSVELAPLTYSADKRGLSKIKVVFSFTKETFEY